MTSRLPTTTGELRKWRVDHFDPNNKSGVVMGYMYNDELDIWEDGDAAVIRFDNWVESTNFYLAVTKFSCIKCPKDEERPGDGYISVKDRKNGSSTPSGS